MHYPEFLSAVAERAGVSTDEAESLARATLRTLADRLPAQEADQLAAELPKELKESLDKRDKQPEVFGYEEFVNRVKARSDAPVRETVAGIRAVMGTLREAVSGGELEDVLGHLPGEFREMLEEE